MKVIPGELIKRMKKMITMVGKSGDKKDKNKDDEEKENTSKEKRRRR